MVNSYLSSFYSLYYVNQSNFKSFVLRLLFQKSCSCFVAILFYYVCTSLSRLAPRSLKCHSRCWNALPISMLDRGITHGSSMWVSMSAWSWQMELSNTNMYCQLWGNCVKRKGCTCTTANQCLLSSHFSSRKYSCLKTCSMEKYFLLLDLWNLVVMLPDAWMHAFSEQLVGYWLLQNLQLLTKLWISFSVWTY